MKYYSHLKTIIKKITSPLSGLWIYMKYGKNVIIDPSASISPKAIIKAEYGGTIRIANCEVNEYAIIKSYGGTIKIEESCFIGPFCVLYGNGGLSIGRYVKIAAHCVIVPSNHNFAEADRFIFEQGVTARGIIIEDDVWIGSDVKILDGVCIRKGCVIGAGAVVTKSTEPYGVYAGVPARKIRSRSESGIKVKIDDAVTI
ncbi:MAG TPA: acyltransferase [Candidatus Wunengus sp. YC60]|uniref:acyltransferase n=1 Tax=Candidatus Wunengus sp. YC60 TaxID=3367697 RepID=UPI004025D074